MTKTPASRFAFAFEVAGGWVGIVGTSVGLRRLVLRYPTGEAALRALGEVQPPSSATPWVPDLRRQVELYFSGELACFDQVPIDNSEHSFSMFEQAVYRELATVQRGAIMTYGELARRVGRPRAARAVGAVMRRNPVPLILPCHRVVPAKRGDFGQYSGYGGARLKAEMLRLENVKLIDSPPYLR